MGVNWNVKLLGCKFLDASGSGFISGAVECLRWCRDFGKARITSNSWGGGGFSQALYDEIQASQVSG